MLKIEIVVNFKNLFIKMQFSDLLQPLEKSGI
jgi:hypothetical protein